MESAANRGGTEGGVALDWRVEAIRAALDAVWPGIEVEVRAEVASTNSALLARARVAAGAGSGLGADSSASMGRSASASADTGADTDTDTDTDTGAGGSAGGSASRGPDPGSTADAQARAGVRVRPSRESAAFGRRRVDRRAILLIAERQTAGRGRLGREWQSRLGASLTFSLALPLAPVDWSGLSLAVGVALADALDPQGPLPGRPGIGLKWPNDLWRVDPARPAAAGRKLGGILIETLAAAGGERWVVVGIGINVAPFDAGEVASGFASLAEFEPGSTAPATLERVALPLAQALRRFERDGFAAFAERYAVRDVLAGQPVQAARPAGSDVRRVRPASTGSARTTHPDPLALSPSKGPHAASDGSPRTTHPDPLTLSLSKGPRAQSDGSPRTTRLDPAAFALTGIARGVTARGALRLEAADGAVHEVDSGEVSVQVTGDGFADGALPC